MAASAFTTHLTTNRFKCCFPGQLVFLCDIIIPIKYEVDWELIHHKNQTKINKEYIRKNIKQVDHDYKVRYKVMFYNNYVYKYESPYKGPIIKLIVVCALVKISR